MEVTDTYYKGSDISHLRYFIKKCRYRNVLKEIDTKMDWVQRRRKHWLGRLAHVDDVNAHVNTHVYARVEAHGYTHVYTYRLAEDHETKRATLENYLGRATRIGTPQYCTPPWQPPQPAMCQVVTAGYVTCTQPPGTQPPGTRPPGTRPPGTRSPGHLVPGHLVPGHLVPSHLDPAQRKMCLPSRLSQQQSRIGSNR